jgi:hypothetical protein
VRVIPALALVFTTDSPHKTTVRDGVEWSGHPHSENPQM